MKYERPAEGAETTPSLEDRFDSAMTFFAAQTAGREAWRPIPEIGIYLFMPPEDGSSPYSQSIYYCDESAGTKMYLRKNRLDASSPDAKDDKLKEAQQNLELIENLIEQMRLKADLLG